MTLKQLVEFCLLWGLDIQEDDHNCMPYSLISKMQEDAKSKHGIKFAKFMMVVTDTTDNFTYISLDRKEDGEYDRSWQKLLDEYNSLASSQSCRR